MAENNVERQVLQLIATDRIDVPISGMSGKLKRAKPKLAKAVDLSGYNGKFQGDRCYARVEVEDRMKARGMSDAIAEFEQQYERHGKILRGMIKEQRAVREEHLSFGMYEGCRLTSADYMQVMTDLGFSEATSDRLYPELMEVSRNLSRRKKRADEERSVLIG